MTIGQSRVHPTGHKPRLTEFRQDESYACKYHDEFVARSRPEILNHYVATHGEGGPRGDPRGEFVATDGTVHKTLSQRVAHERLFVRRDLYKDPMTGESFTDPRFVEANRMARAGKKTRGSIGNVWGNR